MAEAYDERAKTVKRESVLTKSGGPEKVTEPSPPASRGGGPDKAKAADEEAKGGGADKAKDADGKAKKTARDRAKQKKTDVPVER